MHKFAPWKVHESNKSAPWKMHLIKKRMDITLINYMKEQLELVLYVKKLSPLGWLN